MPTTPTWSITYPDSSSNLTPLESHFAEIATDTDAALTTLKSNVRGANTTDTLETLKTSVTAINTRLALNLQTSGSTPVGAPTNSGLEGSMHWDSTNNILYVYDNSLGWRVLYRDTGWLNITVNAGFGASGAVPQYRIIDDVVYLRGAFTSTGFTAGTAGACGQLPSSTAYPSTQNVVFPGSTTNTSAFVNKITVSTSGVITINVESATGNHYINGSYPLG